jgi:hypothetical protein
MKISDDEFRELADKLATWKWSEIRFGEHPWAYDDEHAPSNPLGIYREASMRLNRAWWYALVMPFGFQVYRVAAGYNPNIHAPIFHDGGALWRRLAATQPVGEYDGFSVADVPIGDHR